MPLRTPSPAFAPAECRTQPSCQAMSPNSNSSSCARGAVINHTNSHPHSEAKSESRAPCARKCVPSRYCSVPMSRPIAESGIQACTVRRSGCCSGRPIASSSLCQCVSKSPGSLENPRSINKHKSSVPANLAAACHKSPRTSATKAATLGESSCTANVNRTSFWPPSPAKARRPCCKNNSESVLATPSTSDLFSTPLVSKWPRRR
mmetsp:Transcript_102276/g.293433  ORF Transcript_102276/g.293433 Transcript_102276/m.293433 type:complete len:205 (-) Transcript_102276:48-662(-)